MKIKKIAASVLAVAMMLSVALTGCSTTGKINADATGATLNGKEISLGFMNFVARYQQAMSDLSYLSYFGAGMWTMEMTEGVTMEQSVKEEVLTSIQTMYLLEEHMADYSVTLTEEDMAAIEEATAKFMSDNSKKAINQLGATEEYVKEMLRLYTIEHKMREAIYAATTVEVSDEEAAQRTFSYFRMDIPEGADTASLLATAEELAKAAKDDFEGTAESNEYTVYDYSYGADEAYMDAAVIAVADELKEGEISGVITTEDYYYIIRLDSEFDETATADKKESMIASKKAEEYQAICDGYIAEATFDVNKDEWATVTFDRLFGPVAIEEETAE